MEASDSSLSQEPFASSDYVPNLPYFSFALRKATDLDRRTRRRREKKEKENKESERRKRERRERGRRNRGDRERRKKRPREREKKMKSPKTNLGGISMLKSNVFD